MQQNSLPSRMVIVQVAGRERKENTMAQKAMSLAHTKWMCKYHIVSCPKHGRKAICSQYREDLGQIRESHADGRGLG
jgi:putative transposase